MQPILWPKIASLGIQIYLIWEDNLKMILLPIYLETLKIKIKFLQSAKNITTLTFLMMCPFESRKHFQTLPHFYDSGLVASHTVAPLPTYPLLCGAVSALEAS